MGLLRYLFVLMFLLFSSLSNAIEYTGKVTGFYINSSNTALVRLNNGQTSPQCSGASGWHFVFDSSTDVGKQWVSMLLAARMAGKEIKVGYGSNQSGYCAVTYFYFYD